MELPPDPSNNPHLRAEIQRGKSKADVRFESQGETKRARTLSSVPSLQHLALNALREQQIEHFFEIGPDIPEAPQAVYESASRAYPGPPEEVQLPPGGQHLIQFTGAEAPAGVFNMVPPPQDDRFAPAYNAAVWNLRYGSSGNQIDSECLIS